MAEHEDHVAVGFTSKYEVTRRVWYEVHTSIDAAIQREKRIKAWKRAWKIALFSEDNPNWIDLYPALTKGIW